MRALRKDDYLLIWNQEPGMWPAGHPDIAFSHDFYPFGDVDGSPTKNFLLGLQDSGTMDWYYDMSFGKRPELELYYLPEDPFQLKNLSGLNEYREKADTMKAELVDYLQQRNDLRQSGQEDVYYQAPYYSNKGLASGGLMYGQWQALSQEEKQTAMERAHVVMEERRQELMSLGWELKDN
jgi:N-sulfoglucosamine sulfohydrolase